MKNLRLLISVLIIMIPSILKSQSSGNVVMSINSPNMSMITAYACTDNLFHFTLTFTTLPTTGTPPYYLGITLGPNESITDVIDMGSNAAIYFVDPGNSNRVLINITNLLIGNDVEFICTYHINCGQVSLANGSNAMGLTDQLGIYYSNGTSYVAVPIVNWTTEVGNETFGSSFTYDAYYTYFQGVTSNQNDIEIDYIDLYNSSNSTFTRHVQYSNEGPIPPSATASDRLTQLISYTETSYCNELKISEIKIFDSRSPYPGGTPIATHVFNPPVSSYTFPLVGSTLETSVGYFAPSKYIDIVETIKFENYSADCISDLCPASSSQMLKGSLSWGCMDVSSAGVNTPNICKNYTNPTPNLNTATNVTRGLLDDALKIYRTSPADILTVNTGGNPNLCGYWDNDFSNLPTTFNFVVTNRGLDVCKNVILSIANSMPYNSMYFIGQHSDVTYSYSFPLGGRPAPNIQYLDYGIYDPLTSQHCLSNFTNPIYGSSFSIDYLLPNEQVNIEIKLTYCCPENDNGDNNEFSLFNVPKALNLFSFLLKESRIISYFRQTLVPVKTL